MSRAPAKKFPKVTLKTNSRDKLQTRLTLQLGRDEARSDRHELHDDLHACHALLEVL